MSKKNRGEKAKAKAWKAKGRVKVTRSDLSAINTAAIANDRAASVAASYRPYSPPPGVLPEGHRIAMDSADGVYGWAGSDAFAEGVTFMGYPYLSELAQRAEYRRPVEITAQEMTRKFCRLEATGDGDKSAKIAELEAEIVRYDLAGVFAKMVQLDGFFGRAHVFIDLGADVGVELETPLVLNNKKIGLNSLRRFKVVEPIWTYPNTYNSSNPLADDFFVPTSWFVMGQRIHASRLITYITREVPDVLKAAYAFGGLSLSQMLKPYVDNWLRTRQGVSDFVNSFSVFVLGTNMESIMEEPSADGEALGVGGILNRAAAVTRMRDNRGMMVIDKDTEELNNVSAPVAGLDELQAQSQEHQASIAGIPLVKYFGITPSGLNASSDGEMTCFYDAMLAAKNQHFTAPLKTMVDIIQLSKYGMIDPDISVAFDPLWEMDEAQTATARKTEADTDAVYINAGVLSPEQVATRLASSRGSPYHGIDIADMPPPPADPAEEEDPAKDED